MILIQSDESDVSTNDVLDWLYFLSNNEVKLERHNAETSVEDITLAIGEVTQVNVNNQKWGKRWYRRGQYRSNIAITATGEISAILGPILGRVFVKENDQILNCLDSQDGGINKYADSKLSKVQVLELAAKNDLKIPPTLISNNAADLEKFIDKHGKVITKAISDSHCHFFYKDYKIQFSLDTKLVTKESIWTYTYNSRVPVLLQQYMEKSFEIRIFFLKGTFFSMAIFSQLSDQSNIDFRKEDIQHPNRCIPYQLPLNIEKQITRLMNTAGLDCGSIDMIYTPKGEYVFLEINPVGQYQWLEKNCNYPISQSIAEELLA